MPYLKKCRYGTSVDAGSYYVGFEHATVRDGYVTYFT